MKTKRIVVVTVGLFAIAAAIMILTREAHLDSPKPIDATPLRVRLTWLHQAQFAGIYMAEDNGLYKKAGLNVAVKQGGIEYSAIKMVSVGTDDIGMTSADQILKAKAAGVPVVALAAMYQKSPAVLFSLKASNITQPEQLRGKKIGIKYGDNTEIPVRALLAKFSLSPNKEYKEEAVSYDPIPLTEGKVDVLPGFAINEPLSLEEKGYPLNYIYLADYGINFYADVFFTRADVLAARGDEIHRFIAATIEGYKFAIAQPDAAISAVIRRVPEASAKHELLMLQASVPLWKPMPNSTIGTMDRATWETTQETLIALGQLKQKQNLDEILKPQ